MQIRFQNSPVETSKMNTTELRANFLIQDLMKQDQINLVYSHYDRMIVGGVVPGKNKIVLANEGELKANYFLERRELGIINVGGRGTVTADGVDYEIDKLECVYLGKGTEHVSFASNDASNPALFYLLSTPAHHTYHNQKMTKADAAPVKLGELATSNKRTIYKYIHNEGIQSCQLVMGLTILEPGSVWNTMPAHVHDRRMEAYLYFDVTPGHAVLHLMGETTETKHIWVHNHQAIISPPWSIHSGSGTKNYSFIWGMAGENKDYTDMDFAEISELR